MNIPTFVYILDAVKDDLHGYSNFRKCMVLRGVADSECRFILIDVGAYGKQSDGGTFSASTLYHFL
jgi:hypothetical protein